MLLQLLQLEVAHELEVVGYWPMGQERTHLPNIGSY